MVLLSIHLSLGASDDYLKHHIVSLSYEIISSSVKHSAWMKRKLNLIINLLYLYPQTFRDCNIIYIVFVKLHHILPFP